MEDFKIDALLLFSCSATKQENDGEGRSESGGDMRGLRVDRL